MSHGRDALHPRPQGGLRAQDPVEHLPFTVDVFDAHDNFIEVLGCLADLSVAQAAYEAAIAKHSDKRICLRQVCRVIRSSDRDR